MVNIYSYLQSTTTAAIIRSNNSTNDTLNDHNRLMDKLEIKIIFGIIMASLCLITTIGNLIVIYKYKKTYSVGNLFIISLAVADLIVGCFVMPIASIYTVTDQWLMTLPVCQIWLSADYTASTASILNLFTLSLDRYWSITSPLEYLGKRTKSRALMMIGIVWFLSILWIFPITSWPYIANNGKRIVPEDECDTEYKHNLSFKLITAIFNFYVPLIAMIIINTKIYIVIRKRYHNPIMQYTSGPNAKYSWEQSTVGKGDDNQGATANGLRFAVGSIFGISAAIASKFAKKTETDSDLSNEQNKNVHIPIANQRRYLRGNRNRRKLLDFNSLSTLFGKKSKDFVISNSNNDHHYQSNLCFHERYKVLNYNTPSPIYTPIKKKKSISLDVIHDCSEHSNTNDGNLESYRQKDDVEISFQELNLIKNSVSFDFQQKPEDELEAEKEILLDKTTTGLHLNSIQSKANTTDSIKKAVTSGELQLNSNTSKNKTHIEMASSTTFSRENSSYKATSGNSFVKKSSIIKEPESGGSNKSNGLVKAGILRQPSIKDAHAAKINPTSNGNLKARINGSDAQNHPKKSSTCHNKSGVNDVTKAQAFYNQQEKAFRQLAAIVIGFTICFLPYFVLFLIIALCNDCVNEYFFKLTIWLGYINSTINPFLYALSNRKFRKRTNSKSDVNSKNNLQFSKNMSYSAAVKTDTTTTVNRTFVPHYS